MIDKVGIKAYKDHIIVTTSESQGELRQIAKEEGFSSLSIPNDLGGRYSVLSPAGLLCAALLGYSVKEFMDGAKIMDKKRVYRTFGKTLPTFILHSITLPTKRKDSIYLLSCPIVTPSAPLLIGMLN